MDRSNSMLKLRRVLLSVSDKSGLVELGKALQANGAELVATGKTAKVLQDAGVSVRSVEDLSGVPEAFQGRMKTLSFPVCSGILYRRGDASDEADVQRLNVEPIDCVVVNFYPFEEASKKAGITKEKLIEEIDIGGPTLVRAAAKNSPDVLVLTSPQQYEAVIRDLNASGGVSSATLNRCASETWDYVAHYDQVISAQFGATRPQVQLSQPRLEKELRYGENPHQAAYLRYQAQSPIAWDHVLTPTELSYNNILDLSGAFQLASELLELAPNSTGVVIVKHNNPCGVAFVPKKNPSAQKQALARAWEGDPISAFGGVLVFTDPIEEESALWLRQYFVELVAAPGLHPNDPSLKAILEKRKNLKAVEIRKFRDLPQQMVVAVPGGELIQTVDSGLDEPLRSVTDTIWPSEKNLLGKFGIAVCRALKSNAITLVREIPGLAGAWQLVGAGQGQPNRIEALKTLAIPRAKRVLESSEGKMEDCVLVSDAFFPFRDSIDAAYEGGVRWVIQPGGGIKDQDSIKACNELGMTMVFTGVRHFRH